MEVLINEIEKWLSAEDTQNFDPMEQTLKIIKEFIKATEAHEKSKSWGEYEDGVISSKERAIECAENVYLELVILCEYFDISFRKMQRRSKYFSHVKNTQILKQLISGILEEERAVIEQSVIDLLTTINFIITHSGVKPYDFLLNAFNNYKEKYKCPSSLSL